MLYVRIFEFFLLGAHISKSSFAGTEVNLCMSAYPNLHITCAMAYERYTVGSEQQCRDMCLQMSIQTCQKQCELYDVTIVLQHEKSLQRGEGRIRRSIKRSMNEIRIAKQSGVSVPGECVPSIAPAIGFLLFVNDGCASRTLIGRHLHTNTTLTHSATPLTAIAVSRRGNYVQLLDDGSKLPVLDITANGTIGTTNLQLPTPYYSSLSGNDPQNGFPVPGSSPISISVADCAPKFSARIEVIDGIQVVSEGLATFHVHALEACLYMCTKNMVDGNPLPTTCRSAQYDRTSQRCILFGTTITPTGNAHYIPNEDVVYFEKICISDVVRMRCGRAMRRVPQYILVGHATAVIDAPSHNYCVEVCLRSLDVLGFDCRSAIHFYEFSKSNCILNKDSARTLPEYFIPERQHKVDYIELDECQLSATQKDEVTWSEWSECDQDAGLRYRQRNCPSCSSEMEQTPCFSRKDFRSKFPDLYAEQEI